MDKQDEIESLAILIRDLLPSRATVRLYTNSLIRQRIPQA